MTPDEVREYAKHTELAAADFLDKDGRIAAKLSQVRKLRLRFIDGKEALLDTAEFDTLLDVQFKLRPSRDHA